MIVGLEVYEDDGCAELRITTVKDEFVINIYEEQGKVYLELESGHFVVDALNSVILDRGLEILQ